VLQPLVVIAEVSEEDLVTEVEEEEAEVEEIEAVAEDVVEEARRRKTGFL